MKEAFRVRLLKLLALLAVNIFIYSAAVVLRTVFFKDDGGAGAIALYAAFLLAGVLLARLLQNEELPVYDKITGIAAVKMFMFTFNITEKKRFVASVFIYISLLLPALTAYLIYGRKGILRAAFEIILALLPYLSSVKHRYSGFSRIMDNKKGIAGFVTLAVTIELAALSGPAVHLRPYLYVFAYIYMLIFLILKNQEDIDDNIYDKKHIEKSILPRNLRSFNVLAVVVLFSAILLLTNLKSAVLWLMDIAGKIAVLLITLLVWLSTVIFPAGQAPEEGGIQPSAQILLPYAGGSAHPVSEFIFNVLKYFVLLYLSYRLVFFLIRRLPSIAGRLAGLLRRLLSWDRDARSGGESDYDDETEIIKPEKESGRRHRMKKLLRNAGRELKTLSDPVERIRFMYASILEMLGIYGITTEKSDTTLDILKKALAIQRMEKPLYRVTAVYNGVRYGSRIPGPDTLSETELLYREITSLLKSKAGARPDRE